MWESSDSDADETNHARDKNDYTYEPGSDSEEEEAVIQDMKQNPKLQQAIQDLRITSEEMAEYFHSKHIPHYTVNPPPDLNVKKPSEGSGKHRKRKVKASRRLYAS